MGAKVSIDKDVRYVNQKILDAANGQSCTLMSPICRGDPATVVWCHSPYMEHGKAGGRKAHDCFGCFGCDRCHDWLDGREFNDGFHEIKRSIFMDAMATSWLILLRRGIIN